MVVVVGHWELPAAWDSISAARKALKQWTHTLKAFGVKHLRMVDGIHWADIEIDYKPVTSISEVAAEFPQLPVIRFEEGGRDIEYAPKSGIFVFGSNYSELPVDGDTYAIDTLSPLHAEMACAVVLSKVI